MKDIEALITKCTNCQFENVEDASFCSKCGVKLEIACPECGRKLAPDSNFCNRCGHKLSITSKPSAQSLRVEFKAVGDKVNLASRMQELASPATTDVTEETFKLTEGLFRFEAVASRK